MVKPLNFWLSPPFHVTSCASGTPCIRSHSVVGGAPYSFAPVCFATSGASAMWSQ
jgi:hypothetical protein